MLRYKFRYMNIIYYQLRALRWLTSIVRRVNLSLSWESLFFESTTLTSLTKIFKSFRLKEVKMDRVQFQGLSPLMMFCAIVIAGLCFGQFIKPEIPPCHTEPFLTQCHPELVSGSDIGQYVKPLSRWDRFTMLNLQAQTPQFFNTMLMMQTEGESLKPKTPFWKQAGIYGLEFVGAEVGSAIPSILGLAVAVYNTIGYSESPDEGYWIYIIGNTLLSSTGSWSAGKLCGENKSWWKSAIGSAVGSGIGILVLDNWLRKEEKGSFYPESIIYFSLPPLGATIGLNL